MSTDFLVSLAKVSSIEPITGLIFGEEALEIGDMVEKRQDPTRTSQRLPQLLR